MKWISNFIDHHLEGIIIPKMLKAVFAIGFILRDIMTEVNKKFRKEK